jgi:hypothetical protein
MVWVWDRAAAATSMTVRAQLDAGVSNPHSLIDR